MLAAGFLPMKSQEYLVFYFFLAKLFSLKQYNHLWKKYFPFPDPVTATYVLTIHSSKSKLCRLKTKKGF